MSRNWRHGILVENDESETYPMCVRLLLGFTYLYIKEDKVVVNKKLHICKDNTFQSSVPQ
uniref:Uncharacterized protein n=1 Tax=Lepeophtheirus salmonis TaxID=72036 RepID=A0A0K2T2D5_LEPSM